MEGGAGSSRQDPAGTARDQRSQNQGRLEPGLHMLRNTSVLVLFVLVQEEESDHGQNIQT